MALSEQEKTALQTRIVDDLKQACLDLSKEAIELFDRFDTHGLEAAWEGDGALVVTRMGKAYERLRLFLARQALNRMKALGVSPELLAEMSVRRAGVRRHTERRNP